MDPYTVLEVEADASPREIKSAYRRLARQWHPDRNREPGAAERFKQIASAWTILGDPEQRRRHSIRQGRAAHGQFPEDFLNNLANAIDRAEHWIRNAVLPHYARYWRGGGAEMAARLWVDRAVLAEPTSLEPSGWWRRRKVAALADAILVTVLLNPSEEATVVIRGRDFWEVAVMPWALWNGGVRDAKSLDEAVMQLLLARYAQLTGVGRIRQHPGEEDESFVATAREVDSQRMLERARKIGLWSAVAGLIGLMMMAGYNNW